MGNHLTPKEPDPNPDLTEVIRVETALSRYPIHRLASKGIIQIDIKKRDERGAVSLRWEVDYSSKHGQPGPLAYKLDTLIINRRIEEASRPVPKVLRLGSLHEIAQGLDLGRNTLAVRKSLLQNVGALINAKITYKASDKTERTLEAAFSRYSAIFTGEKLPDGRKADCVYLVLNDLYLELLNTAARRPLDYDYLRHLAPAPQRFYELVSYQILPAIKYGQRARLAYSEFCLLSTMTRYFEFEQVKKQMWKLHQPHIKASYLAKAVEYEATVDEEGRPDWNMFYTPGETAKRQQLAFEFNLPSIKRERSKPVKPPQPSKTPAPAPLPQLPLGPTATADNPTAQALVRRFYRLRYGQEQEPTEREVGEAGRYLAAGEAWAQYLVEFAARQGKEKNGFPNDFGGVKKLVSQAREPFAAKHREQRATLIKKALQSHEKAHRSAYEAFLGELLGGKLQSSLPEAFEAFSAQEKATYQFHKARAEKSKVSAGIAESYYAPERRLERFLKFIAENPRMGLPNFRQWDEKFNPEPFREPEEPA